MRRLLHIFLQSASRNESFCLIFFGGCTTINDIVHEGVCGMKKILTMVISLLVVLSLFAGCGTSRTAKTWEEFEAIVKEKGFIINDDTASTGERGAEVMEKLSVAVKDGVYQIEFYDFKAEEKAEAKDLFDFVKKSVDEDYPVKSVVKSVSLSGYDYYSFESGEMFIVAIRVGDTLLYSGADKQYKDSVNEIIEIMGY